MRSRLSIKILCGVSGSGKSTYIRENHPDAVVCSADHFFMEDGEYKFDPKKLPEAHGECLKKFAYMVDRTPNGSCTVVVDNTNTSMMEVAPYAQLAIAYGHDLEIVMLEAEPGMAHSRNTHGVPLKGVMGQHDRLVALADQLPPWWKVRRVNAKWT